MQTHRPYPAWLPPDDPDRPPEEMNGPAAGAPPHLAAVAVAQIVVGCALVAVLAWVVLMT